MLRSLNAWSKETLSAQMLELQAVFSKNAVVKLPFPHPIAARMWPEKLTYRNLQRRGGPVDAHLITALRSWLFQVRGLSNIRVAGCSQFGSQTFFPVGFAGCSVDYAAQVARNFNIAALY